MAPITPPAPHSTTFKFDPLLPLACLRRASASSAKKRLSSGGLRSAFALAGSNAHEAGPGLAGSLSASDGAPDAASALARSSGSIVSAEDALSPKGAAVG